MSTLSEPLDLKAIRARCEAATKGPWRREIGNEHERVTGNRGEFIGRVFAYDDGMFIAHARTDLPACLDVIEQLTVALEWWVNNRNRLPLSENMSTEYLRWLLESDIAMKTSSTVLALVKR